MKSLRASLLVPLALIACSPADTVGTSTTEISNAVNVDSTRMSGGPGVLIAHDSLKAVDGNPLPCCGVDSGSASVQVTAGLLKFYAAVHYADSMPTPAGWRPASCVQGVPNNSHLGINNLVTLPNGENYLLLPCSTGYYKVTLTEQISYPDGSSGVRQATLSTGAYGWQRDALSLAEQAVVGHATAAMSGATITVTVPGHRYQFLALRRP